MAQLPVASFTATPTSGVVPLAVKFEDTSTETPTTWHWDFGDGETSAEQNPLHTYATAGTYTVTLTASNAGGEDTVSQVDVIAVYEPGPYYVATYEDLCKVGTGTDGWFLNASYVQTADIQCPAGENFTPIGEDNPFTGTYDGNGYEIRDLYLDYADFHTGMFIVLGPTGILQNITLVDINATGVQSRLGALVGLSQGTISRCNVSGGTVDGGTMTGGLVGEMSAGSVSDCTVSCNVSSGDQAGGLIGYQSGGTVTNCHTSGEVGGSPSGYAIGGLVGYLYNGTVTDSNTTGSISGKDRVGGLIGNSASGIVTNCHASGGVSGGINAYSLGGLVGYSTLTISDSSASGSVYSNGSYLGGLIGRMSSGSVTRCSATEPVSGASDDSGLHVGGLIGKMDAGDVIESYATGAVSAYYYVGGLIGTTSAGSVIDCYATGNIFAATTTAPPMAGGLIGSGGGAVVTSYSTGLVSAPNTPAEYVDYMGGLIGYGSGVATSSYWDIETSGQAISDGGVGKTTAEMQTLATFTDWDIATPAAYSDEVWYLDPGEDYPRLAREGVPAYDDTIDHYRGFRGDKHGSGRYDSVATTDGTPAWNYSTGDTVYTTPVIGPNGNIVFRGTSGKVYSITQTGTLGWEYSAAGDGYLTGTVAIDTSGAIYFGDYSGVTGPRFCSLTSGGALRWETSLASYGGPYEQSPVISNGLVYLKPYTSVLAHTCDGGDRVWSIPYSGSGNNYDGLAVGMNGTIIAVPGNSGKISAYAPVTGSLLWESYLIQPLESGMAYSDGVPAVSPETGVIYTSGQYFTGPPYVRYNGVVATSPAGSRLWVSPEDPAGNSPSECASLAVGQEAVYSVWDDGSLRAHDLETGEQIWSRPGSFYAEPYDPVAEGCRAVPSPVLDGNNTVFIGGTDGYFYAITSSGDELWRYNLGTGNINSATIGNDGTVYVTTQSGDLYAFPAPPLVAAFSASPTTGTAPLAVQFTDASTGAPTTWAWTFDDGATSTAQSPSHTYAAAGTYTVVLTVTNAGGSDAETKAGYITVTAAPTPTTATPTVTPTPTASSSSSSSAHPLPYSQQRKDTMGFLLMCWGALAFVGVFCVVIFLLMNGGQRGSGGI